ncbi:MAG TPA: DUF6265 family protein [Thermoanaerobaculia bacterium]|nr:DUF6265 family protein [Thermoanaerobaculia bacterium]
MTTHTLMILLAVLPGWMSGTWRAATLQSVSEEVWSAADGTLMTGMHRDIRTGKKTWFEFLRIEQRGEGLVYVAMPGGRGATEFKATRIEESRVTFENREHDFPKRIHYWKDGPKLCAAIDDGTDEKAQKWCWERVP